jgi:hypothetical protein
MDTPNTVNYMIAGYAVFAAVTAAYLVSLAVRFRRLRRDLSLLDGIESK